jgi:hypothetical protein
MPEGFEIDFLPVGENSCSGDAICVRYGSPESGFTINVVDGGYASTTETIIAHLRAFLSKVYSVDGETPRTCYGATIFGRFAAEAA